MQKKNLSTQTIEKLKKILLLDRYPKEELSKREKEKPIQLADEIDDLLFGFDFETLLVIGGHVISREEIMEHSDHDHDDDDDDDCTLNQFVLFKRYVFARAMSKPVSSVYNELSCDDSKLLDYFLHHLCKVKMTRFKNGIVRWNEKELILLKKMFVIVCQNLLDDGNSSDDEYQFFHACHLLNKYPGYLRLTKCWSITNEEGKGVNQHCQQDVLEIDVKIDDDYDNEQSYNHLDIDLTFKCEMVVENVPVSVVVTNIAFGGFGNHWNRAHNELSDILELMSNNEYMAKNSHFVILIDALKSCTTIFCETMDQLDKNIDDGRVGLGNEESYAQSAVEKMYRRLGEKINNN